MRIISYRTQKGRSFGIEGGGEGKVIDIPSMFHQQGKAAFSDVLELISAGDVGRALLERAVAEAAGRFGNALLSRSQLTFLPPIFNPPKFFCIGRNYAEHAREAGFEMSPVPIIFHRFNSTLIGDGAGIFYPKVSHQLDWEGELAVIISHGHRGQIAREKAMEYVYGYTAFNDITVRDYQFRTTQYLAGKNFRTSGPLGPVIVTKDELRDPHNIQIRTRVNGIEMQNANTSSMHFDIPFIINHLSEFIDLEAGDVIAMGTPAGVGFKRQPPVFLQKGDVVEVEIESIGLLTNKIVEDV